MECPICLNTLTNRGLFKKKILNSPCCNQNIHETCLKKWLRENNTCPLCRETLEFVSVGYMNNSCFHLDKIECFRLLTTLFCISIFLIIVMLSNEYSIFSTIFFILLIIMTIIFIIKSFTNINLNPFTCYNRPLREPSVYTRQIIVHTTS